MESLGDILRRATANVRTRDTDPDYVDPTTPPDCLICGDRRVVTIDLGGLTYHNPMVPCECTRGDLPTFANFHHDPARWPDLTATIEATQRWAESTGLEILYAKGVVGTGKSHLSKSAAWHIQRRGGTVKWISEIDLVGEIVKSFGDRNTDSYMTAFSVMPWLIIDDLGAAVKPTPNVAALIDSIIDKRLDAAENHGRRTMFTSNLRATDFSPRTASRLQSVAHVATVFTGNAPDYRTDPHHE